MAGSAQAGTILLHLSASPFVETDSSTATKHVMTVRKMKLDVILNARDSTKTTYATNIHLRNRQFAASQKLTLHLSCSYVLMKQQ